MSEFQLFDALDAATEAALRASIEKFGVLSPVTRDQHGNILDGHHRVRIAEELGIGIADDVVIHVKDADEAREIARTLNADRRHLTPEQRRENVAELRREGFSERAIAGALGVSQATVHRDIERTTDSGESVQPERVRSLDGKSRPATRPTPPPAPEPRPTEADLLAGAEWSATPEPTRPPAPQPEPAPIRIPTEDQLLDAIERHQPGARADVERTRVRGQWSRAWAALSGLPVLDPDLTSAALSDTELDLAAGTLRDTEKWLAKVRAARQGLRLIEGGGK